MSHNRQGDGTGYCIGTWDTYAQSYLPHPNQLHSWYGLTIHELRARLRELRADYGYSAHRVRERWDDGTFHHENNDTNILVEATRGRTKAQVIEDWKR